MRDKIIMLVIGILIGAIITAGIFLLIGGNQKNNPVDRDFSQRPDIENRIDGRGPREQNGNMTMPIEDSDTNNV